MSIFGICAMKENVIEYFKPGEQMRMKLSNAARVFSACCQVAAKVICLTQTKKTKKLKG